jgi:hypothetical protein
VIDEQGREEIITAEVPYTYDLFQLFQEQGWLKLRRGVSTIQTSTSRPRRVATG